jgi:hydroxyquinol 1,2-dioxygenase
MPYVTEKNLTDVALARWSDIPDPRLRQIMQSLIKHVHGFVREIEPTQAEWATAIDWLTRTGQLCSQKRQEFILTSDVLGVSMLVDAINHRQASGSTPTTVEGPFHVPNAPPIANGGDMAQGAPGILCFVIGTVRGLDGEPVAGAVLDLWQTDGEGLYEDQRDTQGPYMRGLYRSQPDGSYTIRTVAPIAYTIPMDGTVGELMNRTNISHMRPAHIHFAISAPGYHGCVTHLFQKGDEFIETDVVYGVKEPLIVEFVKKPPGKAPTGETVATPFYEVRYDFVLQKQAQALAAAE